MLSYSSRQEIRKQLITQAGYKSTYSHSGLLVYTLPVTNKDGLYVSVEMDNVCSINLLPCVIQNGAYVYYGTDHFSAEVIEAMRVTASEAVVAIRGIFEKFGQIPPIGRNKLW